MRQHPEELPARTSSVNLPGNLSGRQYTGRGQVHCLLSCDEKSQLPSRLQRLTLATPRDTDLLGIPVGSEAERWLSI